MTNQCVPPEVIPHLSTYLTAQDVLADELSQPPQACNADLKDQEKTQCLNFTSWTQYTASICGFLGMAAQIVDKTVSNKKIAKEIELSLETGYDAINGVNKQFLAAIVDINEGKKYNPIPQPEPIPPFPKPTDGSDIEQAVVEAWNMLKPWIVKSIAKMPSGSPWIKVLEGIIESSDQMIKDLQELFKEIAG